MPNTSGPNYVDVIAAPQYQNGSDVNSFGSRRIKAGVDEVKATDINNLRDAIDIMFNHTHTYTDSVGSC